MIRFLLTKEHRYTFADVKNTREPRPAIGVVNYEHFIRAKRLRPATYVFTDLDRLSYWNLEMVSQLYLKLRDAGFPVLNNPALVKKRYALLRALHRAGLNDFDVYRADELPATMRFPVFVRSEWGHGMPFGGLLETMENVLGTIDRVVAGGTPLESLLVIEYVGEPVREGQFRKLAAFRIGRKIVPHFSVNDRQWLVKNGRRDASIEDLYLEEQQMLKTNPYAEHLEKVFEIAQIEYGRADFAFYRGRLQVFEINTNPSIPAPSDHPSATRAQNTRVAWEKYLQALSGIDSKSGPPIRYRQKKSVSESPPMMAVDLIKPKSSDQKSLAVNEHLRGYREALEERAREKFQRLTYTVGSSIGFSAGDNRDFYVREGWGEAETWGTWTVGKTATLKIRFREVPRYDLRLQALVKSLAGSLEAPVRVEVRVNEEKLGSWTISDGRLRNFSVIVPAGKIKTECVISLAMSNPALSKEREAGGDPRWIKVGFASLHFQWKQGWRRLMPFLVKPKR